MQTTAAQRGARDARQQGQDRRRRRRVESAGGLVQHDEAGLLDERHGEREAAPLPAGQTLEQEPARHGVRAGGEPGDAQELVHLLVARRLRREVRAVHLERERDVLPGRHRRPQVVLAGHVDGILREVSARHLLAVERDLAGRRAGPFVERQRVQQDGLARAGRADDGQELALLHRPGDVAEHVDVGLVLLRGGDGVADVLERKLHARAVLGALPPPRRTPRSRRRSAAMSAPDLECGMRVSSRTSARAVIVVAHRHGDVVAGARQAPGRRTSW